MHMDLLTHRILDKDLLTHRVSPMHSLEMHSLEIVSERKLKDFCINVDSNTVNGIVVDISQGHERLNVEST